MPMRAAPALLNNRAHYLLTECKRDLATITVASFAVSCQCQGFEWGDVVAEGKSVLAAWKVAQRRAKRRAHPASTTPQRR